MDTQPKTNTAESFEQFLVTNGFVKPQTLAEVKSTQKLGGPGLVQLLVAQKVLDEEDLAKAKAAFFNIPYVDLRQTQVPVAVLTLIPQESMNFYKFAPFDLQGQVLRVAVTDPGNFSALEALEFLGQKQNLQVQLYLASETSIDVVIGKKRNLKKVVGEALKDFQSKETVGEKKPTARSAGGKAAGDRRGADY